MRDSVRMGVPHLTISSDPYHFFCQVLRDPCSFFFPYGTAQDSVKALLGWLVLCKVFLSAHTHVISMQADNTKGY